MAHQCLGSVFLSSFCSLLSLHTNFDFHLSLLFSLNGSFLASFFSKLLSLFLPTQNIFSCLQNWTSPHYSSVPLSVSSLLHGFLISSYTSQFAVLRCFVFFCLLHKFTIPSKFCYHFGIWCFTSFTVRVKYSFMSRLL